MIQSSARYVWCGVSVVSQLCHIWSVEWANSHTHPPCDYPRVVCEARVVVSRGQGAGRCPADLDAALRFWNRLVSGGCLEYGAGYSICWRVAPAPDSPPPRRLSDDAKYRIRRRRLEQRIRKRYPMFADDFIVEELARRPEYFGLHNDS